MELEKSALKKSRNVRVHVEEKLFLLRDVAPNCQLFVSVAFSRRQRPPSLHSAVSLFNMKCFKLYMYK